jgi:hypothetical protein
MICEGTPKCTRIKDTLLDIFVVSVSLVSTVDIKAVARISDIWTSEFPVEMLFSVLQKFPSDRQGGIGHSDSTGPSFCSFRWGSWYIAHFLRVSNRRRHRISRLNTIHRPTTAKCAILTQFLVSFDGDVLGFC